MLETCGCVQLETLGKLATEDECKVNTLGSTIVYEVDEAKAQQRGVKEIDFQDTDKSAVSNGTRVDTDGFCCCFGGAEKDSDVVQEAVTKKREVTHEEIDASRPSYE